MRTAVAVILLLVFAAPGAGRGEAPGLEPGKLVLAGEKPLSIGHTASVEVVDWNNDGKKDLLVGTFSGGNIRLFLNAGSDAAPVLPADGPKLAAGGKDLTAGFG